MALILAPMEGLLDHTLRDILTRFGGIDWCVSEFIRITGTRLPHRTFFRLLPELTNGARTPAGTRIRAQILGSDPVSMADNAARLADLGPFGIDINFGCPAKTVNRHGGGATLLDTPQTLERIVRAVRKAVPSNIIVSAKMRLGVCDDSRAEECARAIEAGGATELVVHASGCTDLMLGRGMVSDPGLAAAILLSDAPPGARPPHGIHRVSWAQLQPAILEFWLNGEGAVPWEARSGRLKQWLTHLRRRFPEAASLFVQLRAEQNPNAINAILHSLPETPPTPNPAI